MPNFIREDDIEQAAVGLLLKDPLFRHINCYTADPEDLNDRSNRSDKRGVALRDILRQRACSLNPLVTEAVVDRALEVLTRKRGAMSPVLANKEIYQYIKDGIPVEFENDSGRTEQVRVRVVDFETPEANDFCVVTQLWIKGDQRFRRPDILIYINGLPIVFIELKNSNVKLQQAFDQNLTDYKKDIPQLFLYNGVCVLSNAVETKIGSMTASWEFFFRWLRIEDEKEKINAGQAGRDGTSLERLLTGICTKERLLDYFENFIVFHGDDTKIIAQNHQYIGVNKAVASFRDRKEKQGKLGVFWHTQGSGKSFSMIFLARKIFRKFQGDFSFVIITDRDDLDGQIYRNFLNTETVRESDAAQPKNSDEMRLFLSRNKRFVFTLIHKFRWDKGKDFLVLFDAETSSREIIVIVDEAHRTQYKSLAENMRKGLKGACFYAFTGTPLLGRERKTSKWFGDYISEYNFKQAMDDESTVPLFYEKRVPEVLIQNDTLDEEFYEILEEENLTAKQQEKLENVFSKEIEVIKRDDRLDKIAEDIVYHFPRRGYLGKAMVICVDKFTCVKMFDKVQELWKKQIKDLTGQRSKALSENEKQKITKMIQYLRSVEMAVVVSEEGKEEERFKKQGLDIKPHRDRMTRIDENGHDIEYRFKNPRDNLALVFVCAMWLTGFDAPTVSTLYIDKPMKDHTLMQTIARANRVSSFIIDGVPKKNGEIIDYYNVFRNMKKALADYALGSNEEEPVQDKARLFLLLDQALEQGKEFCHSLDMNIEAVLTQDKVFKNIDLFSSFADKLLEKDEYRQGFVVYENTITALYEACKPEILTREKRPMVFVFQYLRGVLDAVIAQEDIESARLRINDLLDQSVVTAKEDSIEEEPKEWGINPELRVPAISSGVKWNLANVDFEKIREKFRRTEYKHIEIADLRAFIQAKLEQMIKENQGRISFAQRFQAIIDTYNSGGSSTENYHEDLVNFAKNLKEEDERHIREGLSPDELELFDVLKKETMTQKEEQKVKLAARHLLKRLVQEHPKVLVQDWYKDAQTREKVKQAMEESLDHDLPESYDRKLFKKKCDSLFNLVYEYAVKGEKWAA
ncbi:MAG: Type I site-specific deoxyribonuclease HsdR [Parcubacteria group bacterium GW2011_GWF2_38_8]|nr:MAG: Type I site-specific deoxyribonuclease HsdR [Parcubacteria group bacterium GW2011_GWF2_38_8]